MTLHAPHTDMQATIGGSASWQGAGIHSGELHKIKFMPAPPHSGIVFEVYGEHPCERMPAHIHHVKSQSLCTTLHKNNVSLQTVEHVLAAMVGMGISNMIIQVHGHEIPIGDGSAHGWCHMIRTVTIQPQPYKLPRIRVLREVRVSHDHAWCMLMPHHEFEVEYHMHFDHPLLCDQHMSMTITPHSFEHDLSWARTFGFRKDLTKLQQQGLALGADLTCVLALNDQGVINPEGLRSPDEPLRHKMLDVVGDLALAGAPLLGKFVGDRSGHVLNHALVNELLSDARNWCWC